MQKQQYHNILIIKLSSLGDVILASPCAVALRELYPQARISWLVESPFAEVVPDQPYIDEKIIINRNIRKTGTWWQKIRYYRKIKGLLRQQQFDLVLDLQGLAKSALFAWMTGCSTKLGACGMREGSNLISTPVCGDNRNGHAVDGYLDVIRYLGWRAQHVGFPVYNLNSEQLDVTALLSKNNVDDHQPMIVMVPGTRWPSKCWPVQNYIALARQLTQDEVQVIICGSKDEILLGQQIKQAVQQAVFDFTGQTTIHQLMALLSRAVYYIGGDTGPMHMAVSMGIPVVALFGPIPPEKNGPYGNKHIVISRHLPCMGCRKRICEDHSCMKNITVEEVYCACQEIMRRQLIHEVGE